MTSDGPEPTAAATTAAPPAGRAPRVVPILVLALLLAAGVGIALYLTRFHENAVYGDASVTLENCPRTETTNCEVVNTSAEAELAGVPISALAIPTYLLLLGLALFGRRRPRLLSYLFAIGLVTTVYSGYLYYVSAVRIGFLCLWCFRLYGINVATPVLACLAAWRSPLAMLGEALGDLRRFAPSVRLPAGAFAALLVLTVAGDSFYRAGLTRSGTSAQAKAVELSEGVPAAPPSISAPAPPSSAASPSSAAMPPGGAQQPATAPQPAAAPPPAAAAPPAAAPEEEAPAPAAQLSAGQRFSVATPLRRLVGKNGGVEAVPFDLQGRVGRGRPLALVYWTPGYPVAESALTSFARFVKDETPQLDLLAVAGRRADDRVEMIWERYCLLGLPGDVPLLLDDEFALYKTLGLSDVPNLIVVDGAGSLVTAHVKSLNAMVSRPPAALTGAALLRRVATGQAVPALGESPAYYPATDLYGACAPVFTLPDLGTGRDVTFAGRSPNGRPTLLLFWSSTCKHCQKEIPQLLRRVRAHPGEFNVTSVALIKPDRPDGFSHRRVTEAYVRSNAIPWPVLDDSSGYAADLYGVVSTPTTFLITPAGMVAGAWFHPHENLDGAIARDLPRLEAARGTCRPVEAERTPRAVFSMLGAGPDRVPLESLTDRPALVHFWATWCVPCQTELPGLLRFRRALEAEGGRVVLVSVEEAQAAERIRGYGARLDPSFDSFRDPRGGLADILNLAYSVPRTYLVARGGRVLRIFYGAQKWEDLAFERDVRTLLQLRKP